MGEGPIPAVKRLVERAGVRLADVDLIELNEAFAAQALACVRTLELDPARVNVNGGAIALGHPIGSSGARVAGRLVHAMKARGAKVGVASLCFGVGQGIAALFRARVTDTGRSRLVPVEGTARNDLRSLVGDYP